jgi:hypothetical protein
MEDAAMMNTGDYLAANNLLILLGGVAIAVVALIMFLRKPRNRHPMDNPAGRAAEERRARDNAQDVIETPPTRQ